MKNDVKVTIEIILDDSFWGFSDLLNSGNIDTKTKESIRELIIEDPSIIIEEGKWKINVL